MNHKTLASLALALAATGSAQAITVISYAIEDLNHLNSNTAQNRNEMILNNTGSTNTGRWGAVRFDAKILGGAVGAPAFWDPSQYTLTSATLTLVEENGRNTSNGTLTGRVGAYFFNTTENSDWTVSSSASVDSGGAAAGSSGTGWYGNNQGRPGNLGGGTTGANNVDNRSNGTSNPLASFLDGTSWVNHTFNTTNAAETATMNLTSGGASLTEIQSILANWVAGNNAGLGLAGEFGNQSFWQSNSVAGGASVGSTIDGNSTFSGVSSDDGTGVGGIGANGPGTGTSFLTLQFTAVPEPSTALLGALGILGLLRRRRN